jgi:hypothetical protein
MVNAAREHPTYLYLYKKRVSNHRTNNLSHPSIRTKFKFILNLLIQIEIDLEFWIN